LSSAELRKAAGPRPRFEHLLRNMPEYKPLLNCSSFEVLSALQVEPQRWKCRVRVKNNIGSMPFSVAYTWEVTQEGGRGIQYDLGQCMTHRKHVGMRGVIVGWDRECRESDEWCAANGIDALPKGRAQPFYQVLVHEHDATAYVAHEMVESTAPRRIDHPHFQARTLEGAPWGVFTGEVDEEHGTWRPSVALREQYPLDLEGCWLVNRVFPDRPSSSLDDSAFDA